MWLQARKLLQAWLFWIAVDVIAIGIYYYKDLWLTPGLYAVFLVLSVIGYVSWRRSLDSTDEAPALTREPEGPT